MKTRFNFLYLLVSIVLISFVLTSCNDGDTNPPVIKLNAPTEGAVLKIGSDIHFDMELSDDEMLSSYKVEIHNNFDGHDHSRAEVTIAFYFQQTWDVSGQKNAKIHHHEIVIPENTTPGNYHLMVYCTDEAGNESHVARNIVLSDDGEDYDHDHE